MSKHKIKHISFLREGERRISKANTRGMFPLITFSRYKSSPSTKHLTAVNFVKHGKIRDADPVLTLHTGEKLRVYVGGDPTRVVLEAQGVMEAHDEAASGTRGVTRPEKKIDRGLDTSSFEDLELFKDWNDW